MIPVEFDYARPDSVDGVTALLVEPGSVVLAGGQSLITDLKARRKNPRVVVDLAGVLGLGEITATAESITVGATVSQTAVVSHPEVIARLPLLVEVARAVADPMVRRRGTLVGACCEVAPGGDWPAAALALDGTALVAGPHGTREVALTDFVVGPYRTDLRPGEFVRSIRFPTPAAGFSAYRKVKHAAVGWSIASVAVVGSRIAVSGAPTFPQLIAGPDALDTLDYQGDYYASAAYRRRRLGVLLRRTLAE
jgi:carbon-monoxide dehydrogenase medium subunit